MAVDYCQVELRLMAHFSGDKALCCMLSDPKQDPFILLAAQWKGVDTKGVRDKRCTACVCGYARSCLVGVHADGVVWT